MSSTDRFNYRKISWIATCPVCFADSFEKSGQRYHHPRVGHSHLDLSSQTPGRLYTNRDNADVRESPMRSNKNVSSRNSSKRTELAAAIAYSNRGRGTNRVLSHVLKVVDLHQKRLWLQVPHTTRRLFLT